MRDGKVMVAPRCGGRDRWQQQWRYKWLLGVAVQGLHPHIVATASHHEVLGIAFKLVSPPWIIGLKGIICPVKAIIEQEVMLALVSYSTTGISRMCELFTIHV